MNSHSLLSHGSGSDGHMADHHAMTGMESNMLASFQARCGTDAVVSEQRVPQQLRLHTVVDYTLADEDEPVDSATGVANNSNIRTSFSSTMMSSGGGGGGSSSGGSRRAAGGRLLSQLFLHHLDSTGCKDIAEALREELALLRVDESCYAPGQSPIVLSAQTWTTGAYKSPSDRDMLSSLQLLLCPAANTRERILVLLADTRKKIVDTCIGVSRNESHLDTLTAMAVALMWSDMSSAAASASVVRNEHTGRVVAAPLNQLVEQLTNVCITPHVSRSEEHTAMDDAFAKSFLATHRYFTTSHALLAKLLQRFYVPCSMPFTEHYDQRGVLIRAPAALFPSVRSTYNGQPLGKRTALYREVSRLIQIKVCCVVAQWLQLHPTHFDRTMLDAVDVFVAENCYAPAEWSDCPAQLMQAAEFIKMGVYRAKHPEKNAAARLSLPPTLWNVTLSDVQGLSGGGPTGANNGSGNSSSSPVPKHSSEAVLTHLFGVEDPVAASGSAATRPDGTHAAAATGIAISLEQLAFVNNFPAEDDLDVALKLTALDHESLRRISQHELFTVAVNNGIAQLHGAAHPSLALLAHLRGLEDVTSWATSLVVIAGCCDAAQRPTSTNVAASRFTRMEKVVEKLIAVAYCLLELNNLHSAFGIVAGLRHPAVARLHQPIFQARFHKPTVFESLNALLKIFRFEDGVASFEEYMAGIPDTDVFPIVPLVHLSIDEIRALVSSQPTIVRGTTMAQASDAAGSVSLPLIHWRRFFVLSAILEGFSVSQRAPLPGSLIPDASVARWKAKAMAGAVTNPKHLVQMSAAILPLA